MLENKRFKISAVICSYNNKISLRKLIPALVSQTYQLEEIIVVDNASQDGTQQMIKDEFPQATLLINQTNLGVGGGYAKGMSYSYKKKYDWVWLLDGDSVPHLSALEELVKAFISFRHKYRIGILASSPTHPYSGIKNTGLLWRGRFVKIPKELVESTEPFLVDSVISSGSLVNIEVIRKVGLPRVDFFMDFVDHEYNSRVRKKGYQIIYVPSSILYHELGENIKLGKNISGKIAANFLRKKFIVIHPSWRLYYIIRNELYVYLYEFRSLKALFFFLYRVIKIILFNLLVPFSRKKQRIKYIFLGLRDGFRGRLGKLVEPVAHEEKKT